VDHPQQLSDRRNQRNLVSNPGTRQQVGKGPSDWYGIDEASLNTVSSVQGQHPSPRAKPPASSRWGKLQYVVNNAA